MSLVTHRRVGTWDDRVVARIKSRIEFEASVSVSLVCLDEEDYGPDCWWARATCDSDRETATGYATKQVGDGWGVGPISALDSLAKALRVDLDADKSTEQHSSTRAA
jgi:hypothetical protein